MVALNFQQQFADAVASGRKRQTIRYPRKRGQVKLQDSLQLYTGLRTRASRKLADAFCTELTRINIQNGQVRLAGELLSFEQIEKLARADGFKNSAEFFTYFGSSFDGWLIKWRLVDE